MLFINVQVHNRIFSIVAFHPISFIPILKIMYSYFRYILNLFSINSLEQFFESTSTPTTMKNTQIQTKGLRTNFISNGTSPSSNIPLPGQGVVCYRELPAEFTTLFQFPVSFCLVRQTICWAHRMVWDGRDVNYDLVPTLLPRAGTLSTRPGGSKPHPAWP